MFVTFAEKIGMEKGMEKGLKEGLLRSLRIALQARFGADGLTLIPALQTVTDVSTLEQIVQLLARPDSTLDDVQRLLPK